MGWLRPCRASFGLKAYNRVCGVCREDQKLMVAAMYSRFIAACKNLQELEMRSVAIAQQIESILHIVDNSIREAKTKMEGDGKEKARGGGKEDEEQCGE